MGPLVVVGDTLLDHDVDGEAQRLCPDAPAPVVDERVRHARPGGAALAAMLLRADGHGGVTLVTALADDDAAARCRALLEEAGVRVLAMPHDGRTPEKMRIRAAGRTLVRVDRGGHPGRTGPSDAHAQAALRGAGAVLASDYGHGVLGERGVREALAAVAARVPVVWDPHPRGAAPVPGCRLVTPNRREATGFTGIDGDGLGADIQRARRLRGRWRASAVAVTLGPGGALLVDGGGTPLRVPVAALPAQGDPCGAGDRFAATATAVLAAGGLPSAAVTAAVSAAAAFVADGGPAGHGAVMGPGPSRPAGGGEARAVVRSVRAQGGTVVAAGGCFDLLHAGHVRMLEAARSLGDCLVVCLNSDASVRARKGADRPVVAATDRAAVLRALRAVDAVAVFDEATPEALLRDLRPDVWAKGADYTIEDLPEAATVASFGGQTVVLPYLDGRSTSGLLKEVSRRA